MCPEPGSSLALQVADPEQLENGFVVIPEDGFDNRGFWAARMRSFRSKHGRVVVGLQLVAPSISAISKATLFSMPSSNAVFWLLNYVLISPFRPSRVSLCTRSELDCARW